jgi:PAS domain S-box-containing protein
MSDGPTSKLSSSSSGRRSARDGSQPDDDAGALPLATLLDQIVERYEAAGGDGVLACIQLLDRAGRRLVPGASRRLPASYLDAAGSIEIGPMAGSCGTAAHTGLPVYATDIASDPRWRDHGPLALAHGLRACWAAPVLGTGGVVIGTFASYYSEPRSPTRHEIEGMQRAAGSVALAIERHLADGGWEGQERRSGHAGAAAPDFAIVGTDAGGRINVWSEGAQRVFGWTDEQANGRHLELIFTPEDIANGRPGQEMDQALHLGHLSAQRWHIRRDGSRIWIASETTVLRNDRGEPVGYFRAMRDSTGEKLAHAQLRRLNESLENEVAQRTRERDRIWRNSPDLLMVLGSTGNLLALNPAWTRLLGLESAGLAGRRFHTLLHPDDVDAALEALARAGRHQSMQFEARTRTADGSWRWFAWTAAPEDGLVYGSGRDVTNEKRQAEQLLMASEMRLRLALDAGEMAAWQWDIGAARSVWLYGMDALHGLAPEQSAAAHTLRGYLKCVHPEDRVLVCEAMKRALHGGGDLRVEYRIVRGGDQVRWIESRARILNDGQGRQAQLSGVSMDITQRKRTEQDLRFLAQASAEFATMVDVQPTFQRLAQLAVPTFADWCVVDLLRDDGDLERVAVAHADEEKASIAQAMHQRMPPDPAMPHGIWNVLRTGRAEVIGDMRDNMLSQGGWDPERLEALRKLGLRSYLGVPLITQGKALGVITFISAESGRIYGEPDLALAGDLARRAATAMENASLYQALQRSDRAKDVFLATLAHELRNPLAPISNMLHLLRLRGEPLGAEGAAGATSGQPLDLIERQVGQLSRLVNDLLDVSRINTGKIELKREATDLVAVLHSAIETSRPHIEAAQHTLALAFALPAAPLDADPLRLAQVFSNLLNNAAKYTNQGGRIEVGMTATAAEYVVRIRDNGVGIAAPMLKDIFTVFTQVTHPVERSQGGLGIGLSLVEGLVHLHGGRVEAYSAGAGHGSEFTVYLPRATAAASAPPALPQTAIAMTGAPQAQRILVVDDNVDAASTVAELLVMLGNDVQVVHDGLAAVSAAAGMRPDIVLLDIGLPGIDGYEAARRIRAAAGSGIRLIALTGWGQDKDREQARAAGFDDHWVKPVALDKLRSLGRG